MLICSGKLTIFHMFNALSRTMQIKQMHKYSTEIKAAVHNAAMVQLDNICIGVCEAASVVPHRLPDLGLNPTQV